MDPTTIIEEQDAVRGDAEPVSTVDDEAYAPTYAEAFPPLPGPGEVEPVIESANHQWNGWSNLSSNNNVRMSVRSTAITQVSWRHYRSCDIDYVTLNMN